MAQAPLTRDDWVRLRRRALRVANKLRPMEPRAAEDLVERALERVFAPGGPGWTETHKKRILRLICRRMWSLAGKDTQRFDPPRGPTAIDDDSFQSPETH